MNKYPTRTPYCWGDGIPLCPHCGKPMPLLPKRQWEKRTCTHHPDVDTGLGGECDFELDDLWESLDPVRTYSCEEHGIKYLPCGYEWIFPDDYVPTVTEKQSNYMWYLSSTGRRTASPEGKEQFEYPYLKFFARRGQIDDNYLGIFVERKVKGDK